MRKQITQCPSDVTNIVIDIFLYYYKRRLYLHPFRHLGEIRVLAV